MSGVSGGLSVMTRDKKLRLFLFLSIAVVAIIFLSAGLSEFEPLPGETFPFWLFLGLEADEAGASPPGMIFPILRLWGMFLLFAIAILLVSWIITFIIRPKARKRMLTRIIGYFILLLVMYTMLDSIQRLKPPDGTEKLEFPSISELAELLSGEEGTPDAPTFVIDPPRWLTIAVTLTLIALLLAGAWFLWQRWPRSRAGPVERLVQEAQQAVKELRAGRDLKDTVMRCYQEMSQLLNEQRGIKRQRAMTPREFEHHLVEIGLHDEHIRRLTRLFEGVRYGTNTPGEREEHEAVACLTAIVKAYGRSS